ncbi:hypothetical protein HYALB_00002853 [Hymenoscyphus albidus]|uniref:Uncharacterized protein n=1 Tax=Hymenoscyphus albidus TaxID=595503 RepID=A0A9N9LIP2_9HELO|nr:hypothetical protein HYALB_00002853 [Hymenoscyphus albidus]
MVNPTAIFLPLYMYPINSSWDGVIRKIAEYRDVNFQIVIAPNLINVIPDINYLTQLEILNSHRNVQTLGYVPTHWATRDMALVQEEIDCYASWANYTDANIQVSGIFLDEAPSSPSPENLSYMSNVTAYAKSLLSPGKDKITFNPGVSVDATFYDIADEIIIFENTWANFQQAAIRPVPPEQQQKSIYLIHNFTAGSRLQDDLISNLTDQHVAGAYVTTQDGYTSMSRLWADLVDAIDHAGDKLSDDEDDDEEGGDNDCDNDEERR